VYWFQPSLRSGTPYITLESWDSVLSFKAGERLNYDRIPKDIEKKIRAKQELTAGEQLVCDALDAFEAARESRSPPSTLKRDEELYAVATIEKKPGDGNKTSQQLGASSDEKQKIKHAPNNSDQITQVNPVTRASNTKRAQSKKRSGCSVSGGTGLAQKKEISDELANFLRQGKMMARTMIVKELWIYIHAHNLQNPSDRREIILDRAMRNVFGCKTFTQFSMNKYISAHVHPFTPVDLTAKPKKAAAAKKRKR